MNNFKEMLDAIEALPGRIIEQQFISLKSSFLVFVGNYQEMTKFLKVVQDPFDSLELWNVENRDKLEITMQEASRLLHNFLSSAKSLVDHTRVITNRLYNGHEFLSIYQEKVRETFTENPLQCFIRDLRNYTQHYALPLASATFKWDITEGVSNTFYLEKSTLMKWSGWSQLGMQYLQTLDDNVRIDSLISDYYNLVDNFYKWLSLEQLQIHKDELNELVEKRKELQSILNGIRPSF